MIIYVDVHNGDVSLKKLTKESFYVQQVFKYFLTSLWSRNTSNELLYVVCIRFLRFSVITIALNQSAAVDLVFVINFVPYQVFLLCVGYVNETKFLCILFLRKNMCACLFCFVL
jgi:hypothetical protein